MMPVKLKQTRLPALKATSCQNQSQKNTSCQQFRFPRQPHSDCIIITISKQQSSDLIGRKTAFCTQFHGISLPVCQNSVIKALPFKLRGELLLEVFLLLSKLFGLGTEKHTTSTEQTDPKFL